MPLTVADLEKGYAFPPVEFDLSRQWVTQYAGATGDDSTGNLGPDLVPPMAVAALSIRALLEHAALAPGTIHAGQEMEFASAAKIGDRLSVTASVASRGERAGWVLMGVDLEAASESGTVMTGRATITFPVGGTD
jgi:acyl dehydratase